VVTIRTYRAEDAAALCEIWNGCARAGEVAFKPLDETAFRARFASSPSFDPRYCLIAEQEGMGEGMALGFVLGAVKTEFLAGETPQSTPGYLTAIMVRREHRRQGVGGRLLAALEDAFRQDGRAEMGLYGFDPLQIEWLVPDTPGHAHNNAPGVDEDCAGYPFLLQHGFVAGYREVAMYLNLKDYVKPPDLEGLRQKLEAEGIETGRYDPALGYDFDRMCDGVGSEYWRKVLREELAKEHPRPILAATHERHIVGFTGPVDRQPSGRGWFTGICTDPRFEKRGIATVLFNLLMQEFIAAGATFSTLFTGDSNHAQKLYLRTGFRVAKRFVLMKKTL